MAKECFCGCGGTIPGGLRMRAGNQVGATMDRDLRLFRGALERDESDPEDEAELHELVERGTVLRDQVRDVVHGLRDRKTTDRAGRKEWLSGANNQRGRLWRKIAKAGYPGLNAAKDADLVYAGEIAPAAVIGVEDTGTTVNNDPKIRVRLRVEPDGRPAFEVERKLLVSRVTFPRSGEHVTVYFDPDDHDRFTFRRADLADDPVGAPAAEPDRLDKLEQLGRLRDQGVLSEAEFDAEKRRLLPSAGPSDAPEADAG